MKKEVLAIKIKFINYLNQTALVTRNGNDYTIHIGDPKEFFYIYKGHLAMVNYSDELLHEIGPASIFYESLENGYLFCGMFAAIDMLKNYLTPKIIEQ